MQPRGPGATNCAPVHRGRGPPGFFSRFAGEVCKPAMIKHEENGETPTGEAQALQLFKAGEVAAMNAWWCTTQATLPHPYRVAAGVSWTDASPAKRRKLRGPQQICLVGPANISDHLTLEWNDALDLLLGRRGWATASALPRPNHLQITPYRQIFLEAPRRRRRIGMDRWMNSGGAKGATTHWFNARDGIRVRYGKIQCMTSEHTTKFVELTLLQDQRAPVEDRVRL